MALPEMIGGKYRPRGVVGAGSSGTVYAVEHAFTGEVLAMKVMTAHLAGSPDAMARFRREALAVSKIKSQHVVRIFDADVAAELGGAPYLVMDLLEGTDLEKLTNDQPAPPEVVVEWLRQVAVPVDKAHGIGIIHRDLKPENLFLTRRDDGSPLLKVLDFGIARIAAESVSVGGTQWGQLLGTPLYMAPEQARGDPTRVVPATDIFALGLTAYKLLTGSHYRTATTWEGMLEEILRQSPRTPSSLGKNFGAEFDAWFLCACSPDPTKRFESAGLLVEGLARALGIPGADPGGAERSSAPPIPPFRDVQSSEPMRAPGAWDSPSIWSSRPTPLPLAREGETMAASALEVKRESSRTAPALGNRWRAAFFLVLLLALVLFVGLSLRRPGPPAPSARTPYSASVALSPSSPPQPAAVARAASVSTTDPPAEARPPTVATAAAPAARAAPIRAFPHARPTTMDDLLGDQK